MRQIENVTIWSNGQQKTASILKSKIVNDNLENSCSFFYELLQGGQGTEEMPLFIGQTLAEGNVTMDGENYALWNGDNNDAYSYIASQLNLTLI